MTDIVDRLYGDVSHARDNLPHMVAAVKSGIETATEAASTIQSLRARVAELEAEVERQRSVLKTVHRDGEAVNRCGYEISSDVMQQVFAAIREREPDYY